MRRCSTSLLSAYERAGVQWIGLSEALRDDAHREDVRVPSKWGGTLFEQIIERDDAEHPPFLLQPVGLLDRVCR